MVVSLLCAQLQGAGLCTELTSCPRGCRQTGKARWSGKPAKRPNPWVVCAKFLPSGQAGAGVRAPSQAGKKAGDISDHHKLPQGGRCGVSSDEENHGVPALEPQVSSTPSAVLGHSALWMTMPFGLTYSRGHGRPAPPSTLRDHAASTASGPLPTLPTQTGPPPVQQGPGAFRSCLCRSGLCRNGRQSARPRGPELLF